MKERKMNNYIIENNSTKYDYNYKPQTNINGVINAAYYILSNNYVDKERNITKDDIKAYCRERKFIDMHIFTKRLVVDSKDYWSQILSRTMVLNTQYLLDILNHFESAALNYVNINNDGVVESCKSLLNVNVKVPELEVHDITDLFEVTRWITENSEYDPYFNIEHAIVGDELEKFQPQVYGGRKMIKYETVMNKAFTSMVVTDDMYEAIEFLWNSNSKETRKFLRTTMNEYFDKENIDNFINVCKDLFKPSKNKKGVEQYNILYNNSNNKNSNKIYYNNYYTNVPPFSVNEFNELCKFLDMKDYCIRYIKYYITRLYSCHKHEPKHVNNNIHVVHNKQQFIDNSNINVNKDSIDVLWDSFMSNLDKPVTKIKTSPERVYDQSMTSSKQNDYYAELERKRREINKIVYESEEETNPYSEFSDDWYIWEAEHNRL